MEIPVKNFSIIDAFRTHYGKKPAYLASAPGRVNLIGEHTDYNGFPVLPIAIPYSIRAAISPRDDHIVRIRNTGAVYPPREFGLAEKIPHSTPGDWANYVKAAASRLVEEFGAGLRGMDVLFEGDIPDLAGLSSSSALVVASALSLLAANGLEHNPVELAEMMAEGERYVGTQGGGASISEVAR